MIIVIAIILFAIALALFVIVIMLSRIDDSLEAMALCARFANGREERK